MRKAARLLSGVLLITLITACVALGEAVADTHTDVVVDVHRIVVIGDIHGDPENFKLLLKWAALVDEDESGRLVWSPDDAAVKNALGVPSASLRTTLVQLGDLTDRGEDDMTCLDVAMSLQEQASNGGRDEVVLLMGNHELMNLQGQYHYVHKAKFGGFRTKALRDAAFRGTFGQYIVDNFKIVHVDDGIVFVHAGFESTSSLLPAAELNKKAQEALRKKDYNHALFGVGGPVWTRKMIRDAMYGQCSEVSAILQFFNATTIVVGHTPQSTGQVETFCEGRVIAADVGISQWMYNNVEALQIITTSYTNAVTGEVTKRRITIPLNEKTRVKSLEPLVPSSVAVDDRDDGDL